MVKTQMRWYSSLTPALSRWKRELDTLTSALSPKKRSLAPSSLPAISIAALTAFCLASCAPNLGELLVEHHFNEAVCAAQDSYDPVVQSMVVAVLEADIDPAIHIAVLGDAELRPLFREYTDDILRRLVILHLSYEVNEAPIDGVHISVAILGDGEPLSWVYPSRVELAALMGETLPDARVAEDPWEGARGLAGLGAAASLPMAHLVDLGTLNIFHLSEGAEDLIANSGPQTHVVYPTVQELRRQAPRSDLVYRLALGAYGPDYEDGIHHGFFFFEQPNPQPARLQIEIGSSYAADGFAARGLYSEQCMVYAERIVLEVLEPARLERALQAIFGQRMVRLAELRRMAQTRSR
ncbi:MAG: hypothetical protein JW797_17520 [Bradymonadales bacterium]|nr:hypothetical protein [Bradymonadales bacterium]